MARTRNEAIPTNRIMTHSILPESSTHGNHPESNDFGGGGMTARDPVPAKTRKRRTMPKIEKGIMPASLAAFSPNEIGKDDVFSKMSQLQKFDHLLKALKRESVSLLVLQAALVLHFESHTDVNLKELAGWLGVTTANITSVVDNLERLGLARRGASSRDRRQTHISLTPEGESFINFIQQLFAAVPATPETEKPVPLAPPPVGQSPG